jgi:hypothetical protein
MADRRTPEDEPARRQAPPQDAGAPPASGPGDETSREPLPYGRRRRTAASALVAIVVALALGALFNAQAMKKTALELPFSGARSFRLALVQPLADVSHWLFLDRPANITAVALGRPEPGGGGPQQVAVIVPTPTPTPSSSGKPGKKGQKTLQEKPLPKPFKGHPMHLYIAGDSMMGLPGMALVNLSNKTKLIKPKLDYHISTGLVRPDAFNWPAQIQQQVKTFDPGAAAVMFGANDNQGIETASGDVYSFGTDGWKQEYRKRVQDVIGLMFQAGVRRIYWIGQPMMPSSSFNSQLRLMNEIYQDAAKDNYGVEYVDTWSLLSKNGAYSQYLPGVDGEMEQVREQDGEHLTYAGGLIVAQAVLDAVKKEWFPGKGESPHPSASAKPSKSASPAP